MKQMMTTRTAPALPKYTTATAGSTNPLEASLLLSCTARQRLLGTHCSIRAPLHAAVELLGGSAVAQLHSTNPLEASLLLSCTARQSLLELSAAFVHPQAAVELVDALLLLNCTAPTRWRLRCCSAAQPDRVCWDSMQHLCTATVKLLEALLLLNCTAPTCWRLHCCSAAQQRSFSQHDHCKDLTVVMQSEKDERCAATTGLSRRLVLQFKWMQCCSEALAVPAMLSDTSCRLEHLTLHVTPQLVELECFF